MGFINYKGVFEYLLIFDRLKSLLGVFKISGDGFYLPAKLLGDNVVVSQIITMGNPVSITLPLTYDNLPILYCFDDNKRAPKNVRCVEILSETMITNLKYLRDVPRVKIKGNTNLVEKAFEDLNPQKSILEICNNTNYFTCSDGHSIINQQGSLMYYSYLGDEDIEIPEGVRSVGRNCLPHVKSLNLPISFDFGLHDNYETNMLFERFCELAERCEVKRIKTKEKNPVWGYDGIFFYDKQNNSSCVYVSDGISEIKLSGQNYPCLFGQHNQEKIKSVYLLKDYSNSLRDKSQILKAISSLRAFLEFFPKLEDVFIDSQNRDWVMRDGLIIYENLKLIIYVLPNIKDVICPEGYCLVDCEILKNCNDICLSDEEVFGCNPTDSMFLKNISNQLGKLVNAKRIRVSQKNKKWNIKNCFLIRKWKSQCGFHPCGGIGKEIVIPSKELLFWHGLDSHFRLRVNKKEPYSRLGLKVFAECSNRYPQVEKLVFPKDFDFSTLLIQENINNDDLKILNQLTGKKLFPNIIKSTLPKGAVLNDIQQERIDCLLVLIIKQFCNLKTVQFHTNSFYENRNGIIFNKKTKKILIIMPETNNLIIPSDLWMDELTVFSLCCKRSLSVYFPIEEYSYGGMNICSLPREHTYYVPIQWLLNNKYVRGCSNIIGYDRFGIVPKEESKSSVYRVRARASKPQKQLPFKSLNVDYFIRDPSVQDPVIDIKDGDIICCKLNSVVSVMNTFPCMNQGHQICRVFLEVLIKNVEEDKPFTKNLKAYYCKQCNKIFMYTSEYDLIKKYINNHSYYVFNRFSVNGHNEGYTDIPSAWASESILKEAGYEVNRNSQLSQRERICILLELNKRGVPYHTIISYLNIFINVIGASLDKDMTQAVSRWRADVNALRRLYFKKLMN